MSRNGNVIAKIKVTSNWHWPYSPAVLLRDARVARLCRFAGLISAGLGTAGGAACAGVAAPRPRCCCSSNWCCTFDSAFAAPAFAATGVAALVVACNCCNSCNDAGARVCASFCEQTRFSSFDYTIVLVTSLPCSTSISKFFVNRERLNFTHLSYKHINNIKYFKYYWI